MAIVEAKVKYLLFTIIIMSLFWETEQGSMYVTIMWLQEKELNKQVEWKQWLEYQRPWFAYIKDRTTKLWNKIMAYLLDVDKEIYDSPEYGKTLQVKFIMESEEWESVILKCNMSWPVRATLNKLATQSEIWKIRFELWNVPKDDVDQTKRKWAMSIYNDWLKIKDKLLDYEQEVKNWSIVKQLNSKGKEESIYHNVNNLDDDKWYDIKLINKVKSIPKKWSPQIEDPEFSDQVEEVTPDDDLPF